MSIFEYYRMGLPMWAPAPALLAKWQLSHRVMSERTWDLVRHKGRPSRGSPLPQAPGGGLAVRNYPRRASRVAEIILDARRGAAEK